MMMIVNIKQDIKTGICAQYTTLSNTYAPIHTKTIKDNIAKTAFTVLIIPPYAGNATMC